MILHEMAIDTGALIATVALLLNFIAFWRNAIITNRDRKLRSLEYCTNQFATLSAVGARDTLKKWEAQKRRNGKIEDFIKTDIYKEHLMQYLHTLNRIAVGLKTKGLDRKVVLNAWTPAWFIERWKDFQPLVEYLRPTDAASENAYAHVEWLGKKCEEWKRKY